MEHEDLVADGGGGAAIFVDESGRRGRVVRVLGQAVAIAFLGYLVLVVASFVRAPWVQHLSLPGVSGPLGGTGSPSPPSLGPEALITPAPDLSAAPTSTTQPGLPATRASSTTTRHSGAPASATTTTATTLLRPSQTSTTSVAITTTTRNPGQGRTTTTLAGTSTTRHGKP